MGSTNDTYKGDAQDEKTSSESTIVKGLIPAALLNSDVYVKSTTIGCYELMEEVHSWTEVLPGWKMVENAKAFMEDWPFVPRFIRECVVESSPALILVWISFRLFMSVMPAISLFLSGRLMSVVSNMA